MSLPTDNSVQLPFSSFSSGTPSFDNVNEWTKTSGSNLYNTSLANVGIGTTTTTNYKLNIAGSLNSTSLYQSGTLINFSSYATTSALTTGLGLKQDTLTPLTNIIGIGSAITALDYNKITLNKPTNFQADWNTTVINKPATFPADMTNIYNKSETNTLITNTSNYSLNISNILQSNINANNTITNINSSNSSNYARNISNILKTNIDTNYTTTNTLITNTSNILITNINDNISNLYSGDIIVYTPVRQYPPKQYDSAVGEITTTSEFTGIVPTTYYKGSITIDPYANGYGIGTYTLYSSSTWIGQEGFSEKKGLFDFTLYANTPTFKLLNYEYITGAFKFNNSYIINGYYGDWVIIKLPNPIILSKFIFFAATNVVSRAPSLWKCYGSNDGITFTEILQASNSNSLTPLTSLDYPSPSLKYEKNISNFNIPYLYIAFTFNKLVGGDYDSYVLNFGEIQLFGKEIAKPYYVSSNVFLTNITNTSNYSTNISNILKANIDTNNTTTNTLITNTSNILITNINNNISNLYSGDIIVYLPEKQYPPKAYDSIGGETIITFLGQSIYSRTFTLNTTGITYGSGIYTVYYSTNYYEPLSTKLLFDYNISITGAGAHFQDNTYNLDGDYIGANYIVSDYTGEWVILKLPNPIILGRLNFIAREILTRAPAEWKCYGSMNGTNFTEIIGASNPNRLAQSDYINFNYSKKVLNNLIPYLYIGFTFKKIVGGGGADNSILNFIEIQLFNKELAAPYYVSSNVLTTYLNSYSKTGTDTNYLLKTGGNITGNVGIGSTITPLTTLCIKSNYNDENSGFSINATDNDVYNLKLYPYVIAGGQVGYIFKVNNNALSTNTLLLGYNGSVGIGLLNTDYKLYVNGNTYINGTINANTVSITNSYNLGPPAKAVKGGQGDRLILWNGTGDDYPYSLGMNAYALWYSVPLSSSHIFYVNASAITTISSAGLSTTGTINASTNLQENNVNLSSKYLKLDGTNLMTGTLTVPNITLGQYGKIICLDDYHYIQFGSYPTDTLTLQEYGKIVFQIGQAKSEIGRINSTGLLITGLINASTNLQEAGTNLSAKYLQLSGGTMTGAITNNSTTASSFKSIQIPHTSTGRTTYIPFSDNNIYLRAPVKIDFDTLSFGERGEDFLIKLWGDVYGFGINVNTLRYNAGLNGNHKFYTGATNTATIGADGLLTTAGNIDCGGGIALTGSTAFSGGADPANKVNTYINFKPAGATGDFCYLRQIGTEDAIKLSLDFHDDINDARFCIRRILSSIDPDQVLEVFTVDNGDVSATGKINAGTNLQEAGTNLSAKYLQLSGGTMTGALTATNFSGIGSNITQLDYSKITLNKPTNFQADWNTTIINKPSTFAVDMTNIYTKSEVNGLTTLTNFYNKTEANNLLNAKEAALTFSSPLTRTTNTIGINLSSYSTTATNDATYLKLTGGTMAAGANITTTGTIKASGITLVNGTYELIMGAPTATQAAVLQTIQQGVAFNQNLTLQAVGGTVGIGTTTSGSYKLYVNGDTYINGLLNINAANNSTGGTKGIIFRDGYNVAGTNIYNCSILTYDHNADGFCDGLSINGWDGISFCTGANTRQERMKIASDGNITCTGNFTNGSSSYMYAGGLRIGGFDTGNTLYNGTNSLGITALNNIIFNTGTSLENYAARMTITNDGKIGIGGNNSSGLLTLSSSTQSLARIILSGQEFYQPSNNQTSGLALILGVNRDNNKQLWIGNSANLAQGTTKAFVRISAETEGYIDAVATNGQVLKPLTINGSVLTLAPETNVNGRLRMYGGATIAVNNWTYSSEGKQRIYFAEEGRTYFQASGYPTLYDNIFEFWNSTETTCFAITEQGDVYVKNHLSATFQTVANTNRDLLGIQFEWTNVDENHSGVIYCIHDTFTGFHRCFTEDEKFDKNEPQKFKDDYEGRIVISTGKIATDTTYDANNKDNTEWSILYDKEGITIEDALPQIELSRKKKDKRCFGVLGSKVRTNSRLERLIVNSVGEGAIWIANSNGNIENGDYITSSDYLGYGEKQDDDLLHNYTVAKATMDCDFELDSPLYQCLELEDGIRVAFIACTYHSG